MKYPHIKLLKLSHEKIAKMLGYKNRSAFRTSTAHQRLMQYTDDLIALTIKSRGQKDTTE
jgi:hypothetical protein